MYVYLAIDHELKSINIEHKADTLMKWLGQASNSENSKNPNLSYTQFGGQVHKNKAKYKENKLSVKNG